jgi:peptide deformylase
MELSGEMSSVVQHEMDHLDGILFVDHLSATKKRLLLDRALKLRKHIKA